MTTVQKNLARRQIELTFEARVMAQLPRDLQDRVAVQVSADAYLLRARATFTAREGNRAVLVCQLEPQEVDGLHVAIRVPDAALAQLGVSV